MRRLLILATILGLGLIISGGPAWANGRFPASVNVDFAPGQGDTVLLPTTFGLLLSRDSATTFNWVCEKTIGYGGTYDPDYALTASGDIYATTFDGLRVSHDGACTFESIGAPLAPIPCNNDDRSSSCPTWRWGRTGAIWASTANGGRGNNDVYVSTDGSTFTSAGLADPVDWWTTVKTAASDDQRIYVSGFRPAQYSDCNLDAGTNTCTGQCTADSDPNDPKVGCKPVQLSAAQALLAVSTNGGAGWVALPVDDFDFSGAPQPEVRLLAVSRTDPDLLFAKVVAAHNPGDALYRSADGGQTWTKVLDNFSDALKGFVIRADGQTVIAGSDKPCLDDEPGNPKGCVYISTNAGVSFSPTTDQPEMACLGERANGTLYACGNNWEPDMFALAESTDGQTWSEVMRFTDIQGPLDCPTGTTQHDECAALTWPGLCDSLAICNQGTDAGANADTDGGVNPGGGGGGGCCRVGGASASDVLPALFAVLGLLWVTRKRRRR